MVVVVVSAIDIVDVAFVTLDRYFRFDSLASTKPKVHANPPREIKPSYLGLQCVKVDYKVSR